MGAHYILKRHLYRSHKRNSFCNTPWKREFRADLQIKTKQLWCNRLEHTGGGLKFQVYMDGVQDAKAGH